AARHLPAVRHAYGGVVRARAARARGVRPAHRERAVEMGVAGRGGGRDDRGIRLRIFVPPARRLPVVRGDVGVRGPRLPRARRGACVVRAADRGPGREGLLHRVRGDHAAERGERTLPPGARVHAGRRVSPRRPEVRGVARRVLVAADTAGRAAAPVSGGDRYFFPPRRSTAPPATARATPPHRGTLTRSFSLTSSERGPRLASCVSLV